MANTSQLKFEKLIAILEKRVDSLEKGFVYKEKYHVENNKQGDENKDDPAAEHDAVPGAETRPESVEQGEAPPGGCQHDKDILGRGSEEVQPKASSGAGGSKKRSDHKGLSWSKRKNDENKGR